MDRLPTKFYIKIWSAASITSKQNNNLLSLYLYTFYFWWHWMLPYTRYYCPCFILWDAKFIRYVLSRVFIGIILFYTPHLPHFTFLQFHQFVRKYIIYWTFFSLPSNVLSLQHLLINSVSDIMEFSDLVGLSSWKDVQHKNNYRWLNNVKFEKCC